MAVNLSSLQFQQLSLEERGGLPNELINVVTQFLANTPVPKTCETYGRELVTDDMEKVTIRLPKRYLRRLDFLVRVDDFPSRSEAIRTAVRDLLYARLELVLEKQKKILELDLKEAELEEVEKKYLKP